MSYLVLARKFRPQTFDDVVQQGHVTQTLANAISSGRVAHAILFSGPRGTGKTTIARILAKAMNCREGSKPTPCNLCQSCKEITAGNAVDVYEIDGASNNSVDQVRELRDNIKYMPAHSPYKIYIIDEVHMLSTAAFNALLKTLEEPPAHVLFFFATTEPHKIPITILSRCQRYDLRRIDLDAVVTHLSKLCAAEQVEMPAESLWFIARESGGSMRDALSLLDQMIACSTGQITHEQVLDLLGAVDTQTLFRISQAALQQDVAGLLDVLNDAYERGRDLKKLYADLIGHFRNLLVIKATRNAANLVDLPAQEIEMARDQIQDVSQVALTQTLDLLMKEEQAIRFSTQPRLAVEMAFIRLGVLKPALPIEQLIESLDRLRRDLPPPTSHELVEPQQAYGAPSGPIPAPPVIPGRPLERKPMPPGPPALPPAVESPARETGDTPESLDRAWQDILNRIAEDHPALASNMTASTPLALSETVLNIEMSGSEFKLNMVQRDKSLKILNKICTAYFGRPIRANVTARVVSAENNPKKKDEKNQRKNEAIRHPLIGEAIEIFGGKVVDVKLL